LTKEKLSISIFCCYDEIVQILHLSGFYFSKKKIKIEKKNIND